MKIITEKPWELMGCKYDIIGEELEVEDRYAIRLVRRGFCSDPTGRIQAAKPVEPATDEKVELKGKGK